MSKSARRPQRIFSIVMWLLSLVFAGFLIGLGSLIIKDLPKVDRDVRIEQFVNQSEKARLDAEISQNTINLRQAGRALEDRRNELNSAREDYNSAKTTFDNWISTRGATESNAQNPEVLRRTRDVENLRTLERDALRAVEDAVAANTAISRQQTDLRNTRGDLMAAAQPAFRKAKNWQELRVFLSRLVITLPLLIIGGYLLAKKRDSAYWPLHRGFVLFALFAFFVELVPYLPSYGGYVRYAVGIVLVVLASHYIIRGMRNYMTRKQQEEERSEGERRKSIEYETALKKISAKTCPGCDRAIIDKEGVETHFCVHCGIRLQTNCGSCDHLNISFHKFCLSCGAPTSEDLAVS